MLLEDQRSSHFRFNSHQQLIVNSSNRECVDSVDQKVSGGLEAWGRRMDNMCSYVFRGTLRPGRASLSFLPRSRPRISWMDNVRIPALTAYDGEISVMTDDDEHCQ